MSSGNTSSPSERRPAAFLDRDGVLNVDHGFAHRPEQLEWIEGAQEAVRLLKEAGYYVIVITNQSGVARGYFDEAAVRSFHDKMQDGLARFGTNIDAFYYCPHHPEGKVKALAMRCHCRKPSPGMLEQAMRDWPIERAGSFLIGDKDDDMGAAAAFGIPGIKFDPHSGSLMTLVRGIIAERSRVQGRTVS